MKEISWIVDRVTLKAQYKMVTHRWRSEFILFVTTDLRNRFDNNILIYFAINIEEMFIELLKPFHF